MRMRCALWVCCVLLAPPTWGFSVNPISAQLDLTQSRTHLVTVFNEDPVRRVPVRVRARTWALDENGVDKRAATDELLVFPGQFILGPGERRSIRVAPRFKQSPEVEKSYRILVQELPVDLDASGPARQTGVRMIMSYATAFYVRPTAPRSQLRLAAVERSSDGLVFRIVNDGNAHTHLRKLALVFEQSGRSTRVEGPAALPRFLNENLLAASTRRFQWRWTAKSRANLDVGRAMTVRVELECESCEGGRAVLTHPLP